MQKLPNPREPQDRLNLNTKGGTRQQGTGELNKGNKQETGETNQASKQGDDWEQVRERNRKRQRAGGGRSFRTETENTWPDKTNTRST